MHLAVCGLRESRQCDLGSAMLLVSAVRVLHPSPEPHGAGMGPGTCVWAFRDCQVHVCIMTQCLSLFVGCEASRKYDLATAVQPDSAVGESSFP